MTKKYTLNKMADNGTSKTLPQYVAAISVCLGAVAAGTVLGWTGNISEKLKQAELNDISIDESSLGWIGSFMSLGAMVMCFPIGILIDIIGRKWGCIMTVFPFSIGWLLIIFSSNPGMIYAGRFLTGLAGGAFCVAAPLYTSEIAQKDIRGTLGSFFQLLLVIGILITYVAGACMSPTNVSILCAVIPLIFVAVFFFQPETPVYLMKKNKTSEAIKSLQRLRGSSYNVDNEIKEIREAIENDQKANVPFFVALRSRASIRALCICFGLMFFQQMSGVNAVIFYLSDIFKASGTSLEPSTASIIVGVVQVIATFVSSMVVDKFGRKILLILSAAVMMISGLTLGIFFTLKDRDILDDSQLEKIGFLPILCLIVFIAMFSIGFGPIPWMISSELMPEEIKSVAVSSAATFNWFLSFIVTKFNVDLRSSIGSDSTFYIFAVISCIGTIFVYSVVPETKGKTLAEVQELLSGTRKDEKQGIDNPTFN
ncbi:facilitated trehalose transporter Tret1 isoform X1 [Leptinotarsa decemlineata]|uniref:facilitated trehalose transporter Tret1 isoform X1 n=2 Tax=Leptinotarsa decemlineata TaxID=7539 RepID=UPI003D30D29A